MGALGLFEVGYGFGLVEMKFGLGWIGVGVMIG